MTTDDLITVRDRLREAAAQIRARTEPSHSDGLIRINYTSKRIPWSTEAFHQKIVKDFFEDERYSRQVEFVEAVYYDGNGRLRQVAFQKVNGQITETSKF